MNKNEVAQLYREIMDAYPGQKFEGTPSTADVWCKYLGEMTLSCAIGILHRHIEGDKGDKVPTLHTFYSKRDRQVEVYVDKTKRHYQIRKISDGVLDYSCIEDDEGYEYTNQYGEPYFYDREGRIRRKDPVYGEVVIE